MAKNGLSENFSSKRLLLKLFANFLASVVLPTPIGPSTTINLDAFKPMVKIAKENGIKRFIYASSSSVYGIKEDMNVTENVKLEPITDYSKFKVECERILNSYSISLG